MTLIEIVAVVLGLISVWLVIRQNVICYPLGIISVFIYIFIFYEVKLYADMGLQVFFVILQAYGWYEWLYGGVNKTKLTVRRASRRTRATLFLFTVSGSAVLGYLLHRYTDAAVPFVDSTLTVMSMAGQWLVARKYIENWNVWMVVNIGSIAMYGYKDLYFTMILYAVYFGLAIVGYREWKKELMSGVQNDARIRGSSQP